MRLLLLSNSTAPGGQYLEHVSTELGEILTGMSTVAFVPYALADLDGYTDQVRAALEPFGVKVQGVHSGNPAEIVAQADVIFIGGGNTFRLVDRLHREDLIEPIRAAVTAGTPYIGSSAGTNVATPSLKTTNDMPIVEPASFATLGLVPFQINPHFLDANPDGHQGETRDERLRQYLEENQTPCLAMREGTWLRYQDGHLYLEGLERGARLYRPGEPVREIPTPADVTYLMEQ